MIVHLLFFYMRLYKFWHCFWPELTTTNSTEALYIYIILIRTILLTFVPICVGFLSVLNIIYLKCDMLNTHCINMISFKHSPDKLD